MRGFTPPFKKPSTASSVASSCTPQSGLTSTCTTNLLTTCGMGSRSLSDQTVRNKPFTSSSRLSLPHGTKPHQPQGPSLQASQSIPSNREEALTDPRVDHSWASSLDDVKHTVTGSSSVQKSSPPVAFVAPVMSKPAVTRSVMTAASGCSLP